MNIICFSNIDWNFLKQRHQNLMEEFARREGIEKIIFIETLGSRSVKINLEDISRGIKKLKSQTEKVDKPKVNKKIKIVSPKFIPIFNKHAFKINTYLLKAEIDKILKEENINIEETIAWTMLQHPVIENILRKYRFKKKIFDCIDDIKSIPNVENIIVETEKRLIKSNDIVFATSKNLYRTCKELNKNVYMLRNAVNSDFIEQIKEERSNKKSKVTIGYVGTIYDWFDIDTIYRLARSYPEIEIVLAGPIRINVDRLATFKNVKFLGQISHTEVKKVISEADICIIPFKLNDLIKNTNPVKIYEYFAYGKPVIASKIPELSEFEEGLIYFYEDDIETVVKRAIKEMKNKEKFDIRKKIARKNTWKSRVDIALEVIEC